LLTYLLVVLRPELKHNAPNCFNSHIPDWE
jgi:hypothetical protein